MRAWVDKSSYGIGETALLTVELDDSKLEGVRLKELQVSLKQIEENKWGLEQDAFVSTDAEEAFVMRSIPPKSQQIEFRLDGKGNENINPTLYGPKGIYVRRHAICVTAVVEGFTLCGEHPSVDVPIYWNAPLDFEEAKRRKDKDVTLPKTWNPWTAPSIAYLNVEGAAFPESGVMQQRQPGDMVGEMEIVGIRSA
jgi:hypothetical protein